MTSVRGALAFSFLERYLLIALALASNMILARLLTPEEIGIYSVSMAVIGIAQVMRDFGVGSFLIQERQLTDDHIRSAFGITLLLGLSLFLFVFLGASWAGDFYNEPRMVSTLKISALNFLVLPFCSISLAMLRREMKFRALLYINIVAAVLGALITVALATAEFGANSMAIGSVCSNVATGLGSWIARGRQSLWPSFTQWRAVAKFGGQSAITNVVTTISMDINDLAVGKVVGFSSVAMLSRAQGLMNLFHRDLMNAVRNVALPAFARSHRENQPVEQHFVTSVVSISSFAWPFYGFVAMYSLEILRLMFGPQWDEARTLVPVFCLAGAVAAPATLVVVLLTAIGRIDLVTKAELIFQPLRAALIVMAAVVYQSAIACALAYLVSFVIYTPFMYFFKQRGIPSDIKLMAKGMLTATYSTVLTLAIPLLVTLHFGIGRSTPMPIQWFVVVCMATAGSWLVALRVSGNPLANDPAYKRLTQWISNKGPRK